MLSHLGGANHMLPFGVVAKKLLEDPASRTRVLGAVVASILLIGAFAAGLSIDIRFGGSGGEQVATGGVASTGDGPAPVLGGDSIDLGIGGTGTDAASPSLGGASSAPSTGTASSGSSTAPSGSRTPAAPSGGAAQAPSSTASSSGGGSAAPAASAAAPGTPGTPATPAAAGDRCASASLSESDQGVTAETVKLGVLVPNLNELQIAGFPVGLAGDFDKIVNAWVNDQNANGGVGCREITWVKRVFDVVDGDDMIRVCKEMTQDEKVFSVITPGGYDSVAQLCIAKDAQTPLLNTEPEPAEWYRDAAPYLWTTSTSKDRGHINHVRYLVEKGWIDADTKIGVIYDGVPHVAPATEIGLLPELQRQGLTPTEVFKLSSDPEQALGQINQVVIDFQLAGVEFVFMPMNLIYKTQFMSSAENQQYFPQYTESDHNFGCFDFTTSTYPAASYDGTVCVTTSDAYGRIDLREFADAHPFGIYAQQVYEATNPEGYHENGRDSDEYLTQQALHTSIGTMFRMWADAANRVDPSNFTRAAWGAEMSNTGAFEHCICENPLFFDGQKFDGVTTVKGLVWHAEASDGWDERLYREVTRPQEAFVQRFIP